MYVFADIFYFWKDAYSTITFIVFDRKTNECYKKYYYKNNRNCAFFNERPKFINDHVF